MKLRLPASVPVRVKNRFLPLEVAPASMVKVTSDEATSTDKYPLEACSKISKLVLVTVPHSPAFSPVATFSNC